MEVKFDDCGYIEHQFGLIFYASRGVIGMRSAVLVAVQLKDCRFARKLAFTAKVSPIEETAGASLRVAGSAVAHPREKQINDRKHGGGESVKRANGGKRDGV